MILGTNRKHRAMPFAIGNPMGLSDVVDAAISATRWRLLTRNRPGNGYVWIEELKLMSGEGGAQLAIDGTSGTASANSISGASYSADRAFNDDYSDNGWSSAQFASAQENWLEFEFDEATVVRAFEISSKAVSAYGPLDFDVQYHDGTEWVVMESYDIVADDYSTTNTFGDVMVASGDVAGVAFDYNDLGQGGANSASAYSAKGNVVQPTERLEITHMGGKFGSSTTGEFVLARVAESDGEILEILASAPDVAVAGSGAWTDVEFSTPAMVYPDQFYLLCFNRTDNSGTAPSRARYSAVWTGARQTKVTGWRNNNSGLMALGDTNEAPNAAGWTLDWKGLEFPA